MYYSKIKIIIQYCLLCFNHHQFILIIQGEMISKCVTKIHSSEIIQMQTQVRLIIYLYSCLLQIFVVFQMYILNLNLDWNIGIASLPDFSQNQCYGFHGLRIGHNSISISKHIYNCLHTFYLNRVVFIFSSWEPRLLIPSFFIKLFTKRISYLSPKI